MKLLTISCTKNGIQKKSDIVNDMDQFETRKEVFCTTLEGITSLQDCIAAIDAIKIMRERK